MLLSNCQPGPREHTSLSAPMAEDGGGVSRQQPHIQSLRAPVCITLNRLVTPAPGSFPLKRELESIKGNELRKPGYYLSVHPPRLFHHLQLRVSNTMGKVDERENIFSLGAKLPHAVKRSGARDMHSGAVAATSKTSILWSTLASEWQLSHRACKGFRFMRPSLKGT